MEIKMNVLEKITNTESGLQKSGHIQITFLWYNSMNTEQRLDSKLGCLILFKPRNIMLIHQNKHSHPYNTNAYIINEWTDVPVYTVLNSFDLY